MLTATPEALEPRKTPTQSRSRVTVDAILEATIQVLLTNGMAELTTTRVAERAGVSVGTMYQYFPNKQALVYALNERYLTSLAERVEVTCARMGGRPIAEMVAALIDTYWTAKTERAELTRVLYRTVAELENNALLRVFVIRVDAATTAMFRHACDLPVEDIEAINLTLTTVIYGAVRNAFERELDADQIAELQTNLTAMCIAWLGGFRN